MKVFCIKSDIDTTKSVWYDVLNETDSYYWVQGNSMRTAVCKSDFISQFDLNLSDIEIKYMQNDIQTTKQVLNNIVGYKDTDSATEKYEIDTQLAKANEKFRTSLIKPDLYNKLIKTNDLEWREKVLLLAILNEEENRWK